MGSKRMRATMAGIASSALLGGALVAGPAATAAQAAQYTPSSCKYGKVVCISKSTRTLRLMVNGRSQMTMSARFGASSTPTREGVFRVYWKNIDHVSSLYGSAMPFAMFFSGGQAIHYSSDFARRGYLGASHGCVNTRNYYDMSFLYRSVPVGTKVVIYR